MDGRVLPVAEAGEILAQQKIPYIVDGAQALGQVAVDVNRIGAWAYAFTGHKWLFGPMGTGGLWASERFLSCNTLAWTGPVGVIRSGGGELENGSLNCAQFAGMAEALRACAEEFSSRVETLTRLRARIVALAAKHRMPAGATLEQRIRWHLQHRKYCGCRPIPPKLAADASGYAVPM